MIVLHWIVLILGMLAMTLPVLGLVTAIDPTTRRPGVGLLIDLKTGSSSNAAGAIRILLLACKNATGGTATVDTIVYEAVANADAVATLLGIGGMGHLTAARIFEEFPSAIVDVVALTAPSGNTATGTITFDDTTPVTVSRVVVVEIAGREFVTDWFAGETDVQAATRLVTKIGQLTRTLPVTATNGGGTLAVVTISFKQKGKAGLDCTYRAKLTDGTGGSVTPAAVTNMTGGTTEPSVAAALALVVAREYRIIVPCLSNADVATASTSCNAGLIKAHIAGYNEGIGALLQTAHFVSTDSLTNAKAMTNQHGFEWFSEHLVRGARSLPCEWAGAIGAIFAREIRTDPNHNFIHTEFTATLVGSAAIDTDALSAAESEDALFNGVSYVGYTAQRAPRLERPITTYFEDSDGNPDDRVLDISKPFGAIAVAADIRTETQRAWRGKKLAAALPQGSTPIPPNIVTEAAARTFIIGRIRSRWCAAGVVSEVALDAAIAAGKLIIQVDPLDETQLDTYLPLRIVPVFAKHSIVVVQA